jgi:glycosyltransferase involved in cell wall biosynthesis
MGRQADGDRGSAAQVSDLLVTSVTPTLTSGTGLRTYGVTSALARHVPVELAYVVFDGAHPADEYSQLDNVTLRPMEASRGLARGLAYARARLHRTPPDLARGVSPELATVLDGAASPQVRLIADGPVAAAALLGVARAREVVYLAHNLEAAGFRGAAGHVALERFERIVLRTFSECWMATRSDERGARLLAGERVVTRYVPNVIDVTKITPVRPSGDQRLLLIGDFSYEPNREALDFLLETVLPAAWQRLPALRLTAVGRGLPARRRDHRIETPGFVEDLRSAYAAADVVVVPLLRGGGSPLKFVEALAYGLPVVATRHAASLLEDGVAGRDFIAADGGREFAAEIEALLTDSTRAAAIGRAGRELAARCYSVDTLTRLLSPG